MTTHPMKMDLSTAEIDNLSISKKPKPKPNQIISKTPQPHTPQKLSKLNTSNLPQNPYQNSNNSPKDPERLHSQSQPNLQETLKLESENDSNTENDTKNNQNENENEYDATITGQAWNYTSYAAKGLYSYMSSYYPAQDQPNGTDPTQPTQTQSPNGVPNGHNIPIPNGNGTHVIQENNASIPDTQKYPMSDNDGDVSQSNLTELLDSVTANGINVPWTKHFSEPLIDTVLLRSLTYKIDGQKNIDKSGDGLPVFRLAHVQAFKTDLIIDNIAMHPLSWYNQNIALDDMSAFTIIVQLQVKSIRTSFITYHVLSGQQLLGYNSNGTPIIRGDKCVTKLLDLILTAVDNNDTALINNRLKLIPKVVSGPYPVKRVVENRPVLLGNKVQQKYYRGSNYFEIDSRVDGSMVAASIMKLCHRFAKRIVVDMAWTIQGEGMDELPERLLCGSTIHNMDFSKCKDLNFEIANCPKLIYKDKSKEKVKDEQKKD